MADILQNTLGDFLLSDMLDEFPDSLPSPEVTPGLRRLVKGKIRKNKEQIMVTFAPRLETSTELGFDYFIEKLALLCAARGMFC